LNYHKFFRVLALGVVLAMLMIAIPVTPAAAASVISVDPVKGQAGDKITVEGSGFLATTGTTQGNDYHPVDIYFARDAIDIGDAIDFYDHVYKKVKNFVPTTASGTISKSFNVPPVLNDGHVIEDVHGGTYYIYVTYSGNEEVEAFAEFTVLGVTDFSPADGAVGTTITIEGVGFDADGDIIVEFDGSRLTIAGGDHRFKSTGGFSSEVAVPESIVGVHTVEVSDAGGHSDQFQFTVEPNITLSPTSASSSEEVAVIGTGFDGDVDIFVYFDGVQIYITGDFDTDTAGSFQSSFLVPEVEPGSYYVEVEDYKFNTASAQLDVGAGLTISPLTTANNPGNVGDVVNISGIGFKADSEIEITYASDPVYFYTTSLGDGSFSYDLVIPPSAAGEHTITASDGTNSKTATFFLESTSPVAPLLVEPAADGEASTKAEFDWGDVSDDSLPVSYELQVAINDQFSTESILVYKTGLTTSEYTLADSEELDSTDEAAPYYWRVRAKDAASNAGAWTSGSAFTVGGGINFVGWPLYLLIAIGAVGVFFLGIWIGRRTVPSEDYW
jgi:hypothetical protein